MVFHPGDPFHTVKAVTILVGGGPGYVAGGPGNGFEAAEPSGAPAPEAYKPIVLMHPSDASALGMHSNQWF